MSNRLLESALNKCANNDLSKCAEELAHANMLQYTLHVIYCNVNHYVTFSS